LNYTRTNSANGSHRAKPSISPALLPVSNDKSLVNSPAPVLSIWWRGEDYSGLPALRPSGRRKIRDVQNRICDFS